MNWIDSHQFFIFYRNHYFVIDNTRTFCRHYFTCTIHQIFVIWNDIIAAIRTGVYGSTFWSTETTFILYMACGQFPDWTVPRLTLPRRTFPRTDDSPTGHFPEGHFPNWTFSRTDISPTRHFPDHMFWWVFFFQIIFCLFALEFTKLWYKAMTWISYNK